MSDLRVTDVQAALRHYSGTGHDVITDPYALHLDGERYGMAVGHELILDNVKDLTSSGLFTTLMQAERPVLSGVRTITTQTPQQREKGMSSLLREVKPHVPAMSSKWGKSNDYESPLGTYSHYTQLNPHTYAERANDSIDGIPPFWDRDFDRSQIDSLQHRDIHEALKSHTTEQISHQGFNFAAKPSRLLTPEDEFSHKDALSHAAGLGSAPFKGLIRIQHAPSQSLYTYNPNTEQLFKHEG
jgi:hypothetical protein